MKLTKTYLYNITVGGFYYFNLFKIEDARHYVYYIGEPVDRGGTKLADTIEELRKKLETEVPLLNKYAGETR